MNIAPNFFEHGEHNESLLQSTSLVKNFIDTNLALNTRPQPQMPFHTDFFDGAMLMGNSLTVAEKPPFLTQEQMTRFNLSLVNNGGKNNNELMQLPPQLPVQILANYQQQIMNFLAIKHHLEASIFHLQRRQTHVEKQQYDRMVNFIGEEQGGSPQIGLQVDGAGFEDENKMVPSSFSISSILSSPNNNELSNDDNTDIKRESPFSVN